MRETTKLLQEVERLKDENAVLRSEKRKLTWQNQALNSENYQLRDQIEQTQNSERRLSRRVLSQNRQLQELQAKHDKLLDQLAGYKAKEVVIEFQKESA